MWFEGLEAPITLRRNLSLHQIGVLAVGGGAINWRETGAASPPRNYGNYGDSALYSSARYIGRRCVARLPCVVILGPPHCWTQRGDGLRDILRASP